MNLSNRLFPSKVIFYFIAVCLCILPNDHGQHSYRWDGFEGFLPPRKWVIDMACQRGGVLLGSGAPRPAGCLLREGRVGGSLPGARLLSVVVGVCFPFNERFATSDSHSPSARIPVTPLQKLKEEPRARPGPRLAFGGHAQLKTFSKEFVRV